MTNGICDAWADLFYQAQRIHAIDGSVVETIWPPFLYYRISTYNNIPGQGNPTPKSYFNGHTLVQRGETIYDPSYGKKYPSRLAWEDASAEAYYEVYPLNPRYDVKGTNECKWIP